MDVGLQARSAGPVMVNLADQIQVFRSAGMRKSNVMQNDALKPAPPSSAPPAKTFGSAARAITPYVAVWGGLAILAAAYISIAVARPDFLAARDGLTSSLDLDIATGQTNSDSLADKLARMEQDLQDSQKGDTQQAADKESHLARIAALDAKAAKAAAVDAAKLEQTTEAVQAPGEPDTSATSSKQAADEIAERLGGTKILNSPEAAKNTSTLVKQAAQDATEKKVAEVTKAAIDAKPNVAPKAVPVEKAVAAAKKVVAPPVAKPEPKKIAALPKPKPAPKPVAKAPAKIKTGSVGKAATKPISFGPAVVTRATRPIGVRIATGPSVDSLRLSWAALADRHGAPLKRLQPRYVTGVDATGLTYDLIAGPFNTANEASQVCARLHANGARCALGEFTGNAL